MGATVFVQPLDLVKNRMQMSGGYMCYKVKHVGILLLFKKYYVLVLVERFHMNGNTTRWWKTINIQRAKTKFKTELERLYPVKWILSDPSWF